MTYPLELYHAYDELFPNDCWKTISIIVPTTSTYTDFIYFTGMYIVYSYNSKKSVGSRFRHRTKKHMDPWVSFIHPISINSPSFHKTDNIRQVETSFDYIHRQKSFTRWSTKSAILPFLMFLTVGKH